MPLDFSSYPLVNGAYSAEPFSFVPASVRDDFALLSEIDLIENGSSLARELWQAKQLVNLMDHARKKSAFWRKRLPAGILNASILPHLKVLSRRELAEQIASEGSLVAPPDGSTPLRSHATTGSTGTPIHTYAAPQNGRYNSLRSIYEYFRLGWPVDENRTRLAIFDDQLLTSPDQKYSVTRRAHWLGSLAKIFKNGSAIEIAYRNISDDVFAILGQQSIGYLNVGNVQIQDLLSRFTIVDLKALGLKAWIQRGYSANAKLTHEFRNAGIRTHSNYSCEEVGPIAQECQTSSGYYHIVSSNVMVEKDEVLHAYFEGKKLNRVLVTHLHSYATPIIRYDVGDFAMFHDTCPCGHSGMALSDIYGRGKHFFHLKNGQFRDVFIGVDAPKMIVEFKEWRFIQSTYSDVEMQLSGVTALNAEQEKKLRQIIAARLGTDITLTIRCVDEIDWSDNPKRLFFVSRVKDEAVS